MAPSGSRPRGKDFVAQDALLEKLVALAKNGGALICIREQGAGLGDAD
jgi:hypothetical protein